jgi:CRP-like cAMP-binding protein
MASPAAAADPSRPTGNLLLDALPPVERLRLLEGGRSRSVRAGEVLIGDAHRIASVWFPKTAVVSLVTMLDDGSGVETATVGREGAVGGAVVFLGDDRLRNGRAVVQLGGDVLGVPLTDVRAVLAEGGTLHSALMDLTRALLFQFSQSVACNAAHNVRERLARWLLQTTDRIGCSEIELTQQFLSEILHARRASVTDALASLEADGSVVRGRGRIWFRDRRALEAATCECYRAAREGYERIIET